MAADDKLKESPFDYRESKNGLVQISYKGKMVTTLKGREAIKFLQKASVGNAIDQQLLMAKATGHFKHGNESTSKDKQDNR